MSASPLAHALFGLPRDDDRPKISHTGQIANLREFLEVYTAPMTFVVGQLVTPRRTSGCTGIGEPHLVVEVNDSTTRHFIGSPAGNSFGKRLDVRVAQNMPDGTVACFWMERSELEPFVAAPDPSDRAETATAVN